MAQNDKPNVVAQACASQLLSYDVKELQTVSNYAAKKEDQLQKLSEDFTDMGLLRLIWDSKVPQKNKKFYHFFTLSPSNREEVLSEIRKYREFYEEMSAVVTKIGNEERDQDKTSSNDKTQEKRSGKRDVKGASYTRVSDTEEDTDTEEEICVADRTESDDEEETGNMSVVARKIKSAEGKTVSKSENPFLLIFELSEKLTEMTEAAKAGEKSTGSSAVYRLHGQFIKKHEKLEHMIKRVECVALKDGLRVMTNRMEETMLEIGNLRQDLKSRDLKYDQMCMAFDKLLMQNQMMLQQQKELQDSLNSVRITVEKNKTGKVEEGSKNNVEQKKNDVKEGGNNVQREGSDVDQEGSDVDQEGNNMEQAENNLEQAGINMEQTENDVEQTGNNMEQAENNLDQAGTNVDQTGSNEEPEGINNIGDKIEMWNRRDVIIKNKIYRHFNQRK